MGSGFLLTSDWGVIYWPCQLAQQPPLPAEIAPNTMETRALQGDHLVWHPRISHAESIAEPGTWAGDRGWTAASGTGPLAPGSGCSRDQGKAPALLSLGTSGASPNANFCGPDRFPQIIQLASELEFNLGSEPIVSCVATGNPLPASDSVELRKADGTVLKVLPLCPCPTTTPVLLAPSKALVSLPGCWAASGRCGEIGS